MPGFNRFILPLIGLLMLCGCSGADLLNAAIPTKGYSVKKDLAYGEDRRQKLDIYLPEAHAPGRPAVLFFYGGSWQSGSKNDYRFAGQAFASKGITAVIADYRLYPQVSFPTFMQDAARAFAWTHAHIGEYGGNPDNLFLSGHSAGGYIAVFLTMNTSFLAQAGARQSWIRGTMALAGPYDFLPFTDPAIKALFSTAPDRQTQPIHYVTPGLPPMLLMTGEDDTQVMPRNTIRLAARLRENKDAVEEKLYPHLGHIGIVLSLAQGFRGKSPALEDMAAFVKRYGVR